MAFGVGLIYIRIQKIIITTENVIQNLSEISSLLRHSTVPAKIQPRRATFFKQAGTWNRRNNSKNNGSMSFSSFVALDGGMLFLLPSSLLIRLSEFISSRSGVIFHVFDRKYQYNLNTKDHESKTVFWFQGLANNHGNCPFSLGFKYDAFSGL